MFSVYEARHHPFPKLNFWKTGITLRFNYFDAKGLKCGNAHTNLTSQALRCALKILAEKQTKKTLIIQMPNEIL